VIKAAVIGVGYLGRYHAEKFANSKKADLVAVVDVDQKKAEKYAKKFKTKALSDYRELPALGVQCVSIVSDTSTHYEITSWLLQQGIDVLVEKPITVTIQEAESLISLAKENNCILQVGHLERFNPAFRAMQEVLKSPRFFEVRRITPFSGRGHDVDVVLDLMIHDIDIVAHLAGSPVSRIEAVGVPVLTDSFDIANVRIAFKNGAIANVTASRAAFKSERTIRIFQPHIYISLDYEKKKLKIYTKDGSKTVAGFPKIKVIEHSVKESDALRDEIESFLDCVKERKNPEVTGEDGLRALRLAHMIQEAIKSDTSSEASQTYGFHSQATG